MEQLNQLTVIKLKDILGRMKLSSSGNKAELISRIKKEDPDGKTVQDIMLEINNAEAALSEGQGSDEEVFDDTCDAEVMPMNDYAKRLELLELENKLLTRRMEFMQQENEMRNLPARDPSSRHQPSIKAMRELLKEFTGADNLAKKWTGQLLKLIDIYQLDDKMAKMLAVSRLRGKALEWYYSKTEFLGMKLAEFLAEIEKMFDSRPNKLQLRKQFENRIWKSNESFMEYSHDKVIKANEIPISEEELVDYIIDGIPNFHMRTHARMQNFQSIPDLIQAFKKITLSSDFRSEKKSGGERKSSEGSEKKPSQKEDSTPMKKAVVKCFNYNQTGHIAKQCTRGRRERGSCYRCGDSGHQIRDCTASQKEGQPLLPVDLYRRQEDSNQFVKRIVYEISDYPVNYVTELDTLLDTGSPISIIKKKFIKNCKPIQTLDITNTFCGINNSKLVIIGTIETSIILNGIRKEKFIMRVVPDNTMSFSAIIGRDILKEFGLSLTISAEVEQSEEIYAIMNIDTVTQKEIISDSLEISNDAAWADKIRLRELFTKDYVEVTRPEKPSVKAELKLQIENTQPFYYQPRRLSYAEKDQLRKIINDLVDKKIIRASESEYASPIVMVKKKNNEMRMCIDYRTLNKHLKRDNYPLPIIEDQLTILDEKKYFSHLDLKNGFYHITMHDDSIKYTAFVTPFGQFEFMKLPFGLKVGPARFQRFVYDVFKELIEKGDIAVYLDDILVVSKTIEHHFKILKQAFKLLPQNLMELRIDKCKFLCQNIEYLGYLISKDGIKPTEDGIAAIKDFPVPQNTRELHSFVGLSSYFRKFIEILQIGPSLSMIC